MARYTFTCEHFDYNNFTGDELDNVASKHTTEFRADDLTTMLENFELFLRGAGFVFDGVIDVVNPDAEEIDFEIEDPHIMSHLVNDIMNPPQFNATGLTGQNAN